MKGHGRRSREDRGASPPRIWSGGTIMQIVPPPDFVIAYRYKNERSVALKIRQNPFFGRDSAPDPAGGAHDAPPDPLVGWRGDTPPSLGKDPPSALAMRPPRSPARSTPMWRVVRLVMKALLLVYTSCLQRLSYPSARNISAVSWRCQSAASAPS